MSKIVDCLLIGHHDMDFVQYEKSIRRMGIDSGAYRDLNLNFLTINHKPMHLADIFNYLYPGQTSVKLGMFASFSATIAYLGTYLHNRGFTFDYVHSFRDEQEELSVKLQRDNIRTIAITTTYYVSPQPLFEIVDFIKTYNRTAKLIIGGPFIATQLRSYEESWVTDYLFKSLGADFYVNSPQGEESLVKIITALKQEQPFHLINNIYYKGKTGYRATSSKRENNQLSKNMVNWKLFWHGIDGYVNVRTSISCPFSCAFCGFPQHAGKYQTAAVEDLEKELNQLNNLQSLKGIKFIDDTFNVPVNRFKKILRMMIKNRYKFHWFGNFRCQYADEEMVQLMKESGCQLVFLGIESGSNQILKNMNKVAQVEKYSRGISLLKKYGIITFGSFIVGFPGECRETLQETRNFLEQSGIDFFRASLWYCERITPIWKEREKYGLQGENFTWSHNTTDSRTASDWVEELFLSIQNPIWVPLYNFDIESIWYLLHRGWSMRRIKKMLKTFNRGIKEKLENPSKSEASHPDVMQLKAVCREISPGDYPDKAEIKTINNYFADFDLE